MDTPEVGCDQADWPSGTLLKALPDGMRSLLLSLGTERRVATAEPVLREGELGTHMVLLLNAVTKVTADTADGRRALLAVRVSGDLVGEMSALTGTPRSATVTTCGPAVIRIVHRHEWLPLLHEHPDIVLTMMGSMARRLRWANTRRVDFAAFPAKIRLARVLVDLAWTHGWPVPRGRTVGLELTQQEIATLCGAAEKTIERSFRELRQARLIDTGYRQIIVRDFEGLSRLAGP